MSDYEMSEMNMKIQVYVVRIMVQRNLDIVMYS